MNLVDMLAHDFRKMK